MEDIEVAVEDVSYSWSQLPWRTNYEIWFVREDDDDDGIPEYPLGFPWRVAEVDVDNEESSFVSPDPEGYAYVVYWDVIEVPEPRGTLFCDSLEDALRRAEKLNLEQAERAETA